MAHIEIKTIKNHDYVYVRQSYRTGNKIKHKHIAYLGAVNPVRLKGVTVRAPIFHSVPDISSSRVIPGIPSKHIIKSSRIKGVSIRIKGVSGKGYPEGKERQPIHITKKLKKKIKKKIIKKKLKELKKEKPDTNDNLFKFFSI